MPKFTFEAVPSKTSENGDSTIDQAELFRDISQELNADLFIYSGGLKRDLASLFIAEASRAKSRENVALVLSTYGGDADAAYIIARHLKNAYEKFTLYVFGFCKSAGTLLALGADEIVMSNRGELGPLDVQLLKTDEVLFRGSGLDITQAILSLSEKSYEVFERHFFEIIRLGRGAITTKTAADLASHLSADLLKPITAQIDPLRVGEVERAINIAYEYGTRLNNNAARVNALIRDYPSHGFVIDCQEARGLFGNVRPQTDKERLLESVLRELDEQGTACITAPNNEGMIGYLQPKQEKQDEEQQANGDAQQIVAGDIRNGHSDQAAQQIVTDVRAGASEDPQPAESASAHSGG